MNPASAAPARRRRAWVRRGGLALLAGAAVAVGWSQRGRPEDRANALLSEVLTGLRPDAPPAVRALLRRGASVHTRGRGGDTPLLCASFWGDEELVRDCLARGADANAVSADGSSALMLAAAAPGRAGVVRLLLDAGCDPNHRRPNGGSALHHAAGNGDVPAVELLLRRGADPHARLARGDTPLSLARGCVRVADGAAAAALLEAAGADRP